MKLNARAITSLAVLSALAMILSYIESMIPLSVSVPGVKIGLANLVIVFALYSLGAKAAILISSVRLILSAILFGNFMTFAYSLAGAALSLFVMILLVRTGKFTAIGVSVAGGVMHNAGQILVAAIVMETSQITYYLPVLVVSGTFFGVIIGILGALLVKRIPKSVI